jgi:hypothetical protein
MSAHIQSALHYRLSLPAWLLAIVIAIAIAAAALIAGSSEQSTPPEGANASQSTRAPAPDMDPACLDSAVGHC